MYPYLIIFMLYYVAGLEYSFQLYQNLGRLDDMSGHKEVLLSNFVIPFLWIPMILFNQWRKAKSWYWTKYSHRTNKYLKKQY